MSDIRVDFGKWSGADVLAEYGLMLQGSFAYSQGMNQGFGYSVDRDFIIKFIRVCNVDSLRKTNGKVLKVTYTWDKILKLENPWEDNLVFDIEAWSKGFSDNNVIAEPSLKTFKNKHNQGYGAEIVYHDVRFVDAVANIVGSEGAKELRVNFPQRTAWVDGDPYDFSIVITGKRENA